jgi:flavodoxin I
MSKIGLFYGSSVGNTEDAARSIQRAFDAFQPGLVSLVNIAGYASIRTMPNYEYVIIGASSWLDGGLQEDWLRVLPQMGEIDLQGKKVALFGLGDQVNYPDAFQDAIGILAQHVRQRGAVLVGRWPTEGYTFTASRGVEDGMFLGLSLDNDNQLHLTEQRVRQWVQQLLQEFGLQ